MSLNIPSGTGPAPILSEIALASNGKPFRIESYRVARDRRSQVIARLYRLDTPPAEALAERLKGCRSRTPCKSAACPSCLRRFRQRLLHEATPFLVGCDVLRLSWVPPRSMIPCEDLEAFDLARFHDTCLRSLQRVLPAEAVLVGGIDVSLNTFENQNPHWAFHVYGLIALPRGRDLQVVERQKAALRQLPVHGDTASPIRLKLVPEDAVIERLLSYSFKSSFYRRSGYQYDRASTGGRNRNTAPQALPSSAATKLSLYLDGFSIQTRLLLVGLRRYGPVSKFTLRPTAGLSSR